MKVFVYVFLWIGCCAPVFSQEVISLYKGIIPNSLDVPDGEKTEVRSAGDTVVRNVTEPSLTVFLPPVEKATGIAVIICPGGGYQALMISREGYRVARAFNERGIAAFVLKYRLPSDQTMEDKSLGPAQDAQRAIELVRMHADDWHINPDKVGIMGFSAGGHLASTVATHYAHPFIDNSRSINLRPDFQLLIYPVISFDESITHKGSRDALLGPALDREQVDFFSNERHINKHSPPAFITHAKDDSLVPIANSQRYYRALQENKVPATWKVYEKGGHGYRQSPLFEEWFGVCVDWINQQRFLQ